MKIFSILFMSAILAIHSEAWSNDNKNHIYFECALRKSFVDGNRPAVIFDEKEFFHISSNVWETWDDKKSEWTNNICIDKFGEVHTILRTCGINEDKIYFEVMYTYVDESGDKISYSGNITVNRKDGSYVENSYKLGGKNGEKDLIVSASGICKKTQINERSSENNKF